MRVAYRAASTFTRTLSREEIQGCILNALWRAIKKYDRTRMTKLTTYLYNGVVFECLNQKRSNKRRGQDLYGQDAPCSHNDLEKVDMLDAIYEKCDHPELVIDRFYGGMTIEELASKHSVCNEAIRLKLKKNIEKLRKTLAKSV